MSGWGMGLSLRGAPGLSVLSGSGSPTGAGAESQVYVDTANGKLFTYTNGAWVAGTSLVGPMGMNALNAQLLHGDGAPTTSTFANNADALYLQSDGSVWYFDFEGDKTWTKSSQNLTGPQGPAGVGKDGLRGTQTYTGNGAPSSDLSSFSPPAVAGDLYYQLDGGPALFVLS